MTEKIQHLYCCILHTALTHPTHHSLPSISLFTLHSTYMYSLSTRATHYTHPPHNPLHSPSPQPTSLTLPTAHFTHPPHSPLHSPSPQPTTLTLPTAHFTHPPHSPLHSPSPQPTSLTLPTAHYTHPPHSPLHSPSQQPTSLTLPTAHFTHPPHSPLHSPSPQPTSLTLPTAHFTHPPHSPLHSPSPQPTSLTLPTAHFTHPPHSPLHSPSPQPTSLTLPTAHFTHPPNSPLHSPSPQPTSLTLPTAHFTHPPHSPLHSPSPFTLIGSLKLHIVCVTLCQCSLVHSKVTFTAIDGEERHGALTDGQGTRRPGGRRGKGRVHLRESGLQGGGPGGVPPFVSGADHSRGRRGTCGPLPFLGRLQGTTLQCCMASALVATTDLNIPRYTHTYTHLYLHKTRNSNTQSLQTSTHKRYLSPPAGLGMPHEAASVGGAQVFWVPHVEVCQGEVLQLSVVGHFHLEELLASTVQLQENMVVGNGTMYTSKAHTYIHTYVHSHIQYMYHSMLTFSHTQHTHTCTHMHICMYIHTYVNTHMCTVNVQQHPNPYEPASLYLLWLAWA